MTENYELKAINKLEMSSNTNSEKFDQDQLNNNVAFVQTKRTGICESVRKNWDKYVYTLCILINYVNYGLVFNLGPPAMVDFRYLLRTTMVKFNYGETIRALGYLIGSLSGFLYNYINRQMTLAIMTAILGVFTIMEPLSQNLIQYFLYHFLDSVGGGAWDSGNTVWIIEMWGEKSSSVLHLQQFTYGLGSILGPLLISPYVVGDLSNKTTVSTSPSEYTTVSGIFSTTHLFNDSSADDINYSVDRRSKLRIPYMTGGVLTLTMPTVLLIMFLIKRYKTPENETKTKINENITVIDVKTKTEPQELTPMTRNILIVLFAVSLLFYNGLETTFMIYNSTFCQYLPINISASKAAQLTSILSATYTLGRAVSALIASRVRADIMLSYHIVIIGLSLTVIYLGQNKETLIYIGMSMLGFGYSAMWPSYFMYAENTIKLNDKISSIFFFTSTILLLTSPFVVAPLIEKQPDILLNLSFGYFSFVVFLFMTILVIEKRSQRYPVLYTVNEQTHNN